ncbi:hypothetical protein [Gilliamella sp. Occ3-1]|uniref:hypothetical protein n=1 Tax=Gilliamella sp. Occ3-1 TaxID=3120253 RepID=UPI00159EDADE|nr:hypothetical protein [Gilliamella apicola]
MPTNFGETGSDMGSTNMVNLMTFHGFEGHVKPMIHVAKMHQRHGYIYCLFLYF